MSALIFFGIYFFKLSFIITRTWSGGFVVHKVEWITRGGQTKPFILSLSKDGECLTGVASFDKLDERIYICAEYEVSKG